MAEIEGEISEKLEIWTPVKEDKLVAAWQCHECLFNITSFNYSNRGMKEKAWQEIATEVEMYGEPFVPKIKIASVNLNR